MAKQEATFGGDQIAQIESLVEAMVDMRISALSEGETGRIKSIVEEAVSSVPSTKEVRSASDLYTIRWRKGVTGVQTGFLRASSLEKAERVGRAYCNAIPGCRYIHVVPAVIADESILDKSVAEDLSRTA